jgi:hypothetical protein
MAVLWLFLTVFLLYGAWYVKALTLHFMEGFRLVQKMDTTGAGCEMTVMS